MSADAENSKGESIAISKFWEEELKSMPYLSCKYNLFCDMTSIFFMNCRKEWQDSLPP